MDGSELTKTTKAQWNENSTSKIMKKKNMVKSQCKFLLIDTNEMWKKMEHAEREGGRAKLYMQAAAIV